MRRWTDFLMVMAAVCLMIGMAAPSAAGERQAVRARAERFWNAEVSKDWGAVYELLSGADRESQTRDEYAAARQAAGPLDYREAAVEDVLLDKDLAWAHVKFKFVLLAHPQIPPTPGAYWQVWRKDGNWYAVGAGERGQWPRLPPQLRPAGDEAAVTTRSNELWQARVAGDWKTVYRYLAPDYRADVSLDEFLGRKAKYLYYAPRVEWAEVEGGAARVKVAFTHKYSDPAASKMEPVEGVLIEKWRKADGEWFFDARSN